METISILSNVASDFFKSELWIYIRTLLVIGLTIGILSSLVTEAIKRSDDKVFLKHSMPIVALWYVNIFINLMFTCLVTINYSVGGFYQTISFIVQVWFISWALSILAYDYFLDSLFTSLSLFKTWLKTLETKAKVKLKDLKEQLNNKETV